MLFGEDIYCVTASQTVHCIVLSGTNDAFVTIALGDKKFQTTIKDKVIDPEWYEECDM